MFPDAKWIDVLKLPTKTRLAVALACASLWGLLRADLLTFGKWDPLLSGALLVLFVLSTITVLVDGMAWLAKPVTERANRSRLSMRREVRRKEQEEAREQQRVRILAQLDHLSGRELAVVGKALRENSPTFYTYVHSPPVGMLLAKSIVWTTNGSHHRDHYPFTIADFVWDELLRRRDEFLAKDEAANGR